MKGPAAILLSMLGLAGGVGCGDAGSGPPRPLIPEPATARAALELALLGWSERGARRGDLAGARVELADRRIAEGDAPDGFAILGPVREDWGRGFVVRLEWGDDRGTETTTYVVAGLDPIWVLRKDDVDLLMHWEHPMEPTATAEAGEAGPAPEPIGEGP